jgi:hypothetical protein
MCGTVAFRVLLNPGKIGLPASLDNRTHSIC